MAEDTRHAESSKLVAFYRGERPDIRRRSIDEIRAWDDAQLEAVHDYIQWLFPTRERSRFNPMAPVLDPETIQAFRTDATLRAGLGASFRRMLQFYGFTLEEQEGSLQVTPSAEWATRKRVWLTPGNHNFLRITRILSCLATLGLGEHAEAFLHALNAVYRDEAQRIIPMETLLFWQRAATER